MTVLDNRLNGFENKFKQEQENNFKHNIKAIKNTISWAVNEFSTSALDVKELIDSVVSVGMLNPIKYIDLIHNELNKKSINVDQNTLKVKLQSELQSVKSQSDSFSR